jgi:hypothetical protein
MLTETAKNITNIGIKRIIPAANNKHLAKPLVYDL